MGAGRVRGVIAATGIVALLVASSAAPASSAAAGVGSSAEAAAIVDGWSVEQQIAQMVLFEVEIDNPRYVPSEGGSTSAAVDELTSYVTDLNVGGFVLEEGNRDLYLDPALGTLKDLEAHGIYPFVAANEEGGPVQIAAERTFDSTSDWIGCTNLGPLDGYEQQHPVPWGSFECIDATWPPPGEHSEAEDVHYFPYLRNAFAMASGTEPGERWTLEQTAVQLADVGAALPAVGLNLDLAPVLGVSDGTTASSLLGDRVFADDPATVTEYAAAFSAGIQLGSVERTGEPVGTVVKHFPGLGTVTTNTDDAPGVSAPLPQLETKDLVPYRSLDRYDATAVMMSNAAVPGLTCPLNATQQECEDAPPATLTPAAYELLRAEPYGWDGVVVTDTLAGGSVIYDGRTIVEAAEEAVAAGADLIEIKPVAPPNTQDWFPTAADNRQLLDEAIAAIRAWAGDDADRLAQIRASAIRVVQAKLDLAARRPVPPAPPPPPDPPGPVAGRPTFTG